MVSLPFRPPKIRAAKSILVRVEGRRFRALTEGMEKPYDPRLHDCMWQGALDLCEDFIGARVAHVWGDQITLVLLPGKEVMFAGDTQALCSAAASVVTAGFYGQWLRHGLSGVPRFRAYVESVPLSRAISYLEEQREQARQRYFRARGACESPENQIEEDIPPHHQFGAWVHQESYLGERGEMKRQWVVSLGFPPWGSDAGVFFSSVS